MVDEPTPERDVEALKQRIDDLAEEIREARADWERKRKDRSVPGAEPPEDGDTRDPAIESEQETETPA